MPTREVTLEIAIHARQLRYVESGPAIEVEILAETPGAVAEPQRRSADERQLVEVFAFHQAVQDVVVENFLFNCEFQAFERWVVLNGKLDQVRQILLHSADTPAAACSSRISR